MAAKGQKYKNWNENIKNEIIDLLNKGHSARELARNYPVSRGTISTWQQKLWHPEKYPNQGQKRGRLKESILTKDGWKERYEILKKYQAFLKAQRERK